jgi:hypothetical protein
MAKIRLYMILAFRYTNIYYTGQVNLAEIMESIVMVLRTRLN